jgi:hypothetical protein
MVPHSLLALSGRTKQAGVRREHDTATDISLAHQAPSICESFDLGF